MFDGLRLFAYMVGHSGSPAFRRPFSNFAMCSGRPRQGIIAPFRYAMFEAGERTRKTDAASFLE